MNWKAEVIADSSGTWAGNALVFATEPEALQYVGDLANRWTAVRETRVVETDAAVTHQIVDNVLRNVALEPELVTYRIVRFHSIDENEVIERGLTLAEAQAHCKRDDTHGPGWFDGYAAEEA